MQSLINLSWVWWLFMLCVSHGMWLFDSVTKLDKIKTFGATLRSLIETNMRKTRQSRIFKQIFIFIFSFDDIRNQHQIIFFQQKGITIILAEFYGRLGHFLSKIWSHYRRENYVAVTDRMKIACHFKLKTNIA